MAFERRGPAGWSIHPGEILKEEFLKPLQLSGYALAKALGVTPQRVSDIVLRKTGISADMALLLGRFFGTTPEFWMNLQSSYALAMASRSLRRKVEKIRPHAKSVA
jgi:antitoxin HigA-1